MDAQPLQKQNHDGKVGKYDGQTLSYPTFINGRYGNPWTTWVAHSLIEVSRFLWTSATQLKALAGVPVDKDVLDKALPVVKPDFTVEGDRPKVTWIGHATVLLQIDGVTVLTDPVFSDRCTPFQSVRWFGTSRYRPTPCTIGELPKLDAVVISHNHYDHLDVFSVQTLNARFGSSLRWYVPAGTARWMEDTGCENVVEMGWWEENKLPGTDVVFAFTPCQHWCRRSAFDYCKQLWGSWCIIGPRHRFFFPGDTGYCEAFQEIGKVYGPFDGAAIPIGAYEPRSFMKYAHVMPEESVKIHCDVGSLKSVAIHWGTFSLTTEPYLDPPVRLKESLKEAGIPEKDFQILNHGGSLAL